MGSFQISNCSLAEGRRPLCSLCSKWYFKNKKLKNKTNSWLLITFLAAWREWTCFFLFFPPKIAILKIAEKVTTYWTQPCHFFSTSEPQSGLVYVFAFFAEVFEQSASCLSSSQPAAGRAALHPPSLPPTFFPMAHFPSLCSASAHHPTQEERQGLISEVRSISSLTPVTTVSNIIHKMKACADISLLNRKFFFFLILNWFLKICRSELVALPGEK